MSDQPTILAVDDRPEDQALLCGILTAAGYQVRLAASGELALAAVAAHPPDLIVLNVRLKGRDGLEACRQLQARAETRPIPILLLSAVADVTAWVEGLQLGAVDYLAKPFRREELLSRVKTHLALSGARRSLEQRDAALRESNARLKFEIDGRQRVEKDLRQNLERAERSRRAMLSTLEDRKRAEAALKARNEQYGMLFRELPAGLVSYGIITGAAGEPASYRFLTVNPAFERLTGLTAEKVIGKTVSDVLPQAETHWLERLGRVAASGASATFETYSADLGKHFSVSAFRAAPDQVACTFIDVTEQKAHVVEIERANRLYATLIQVNDVIVSCKSRNDLFRQLCQVVVAFGKFRAAWVGVKSETGGQLTIASRHAAEPNSDFSLPGQTGSCGILAEAVRTGLPCLCNDVLQDPRVDCCRPVFDQLGIRSCAAFPFRFGGEVCGALCICSTEASFFNPAEVRLLEEVVRDLSYALEHLDQEARRQAADAALHESEARYRVQFESSHDALMTLAPPDWRYTSANPMTLRMFGAATETEFTAATPWQISPTCQSDGALSEEKARDLIAIAMREGSHFFDWTHRRLNGEEFPATVLLSRLQLGATTILQAAVRDVTEQKRLEAQYLRAQRLEGLGTLAGGIAHDLNNILFPVLLGSQSLQGAQLTPGQREVALMMESCAKRGTDIIKQILTFARGTEEAKGPLQTKHVIREVLSMIRETFPRSITILDDVPSDLWPVVGNATHLHQVLLNLCVNARDAMPAGGTLTISAENRRGDETFAQMAALPAAGTYIVWTIADTGEGIPSENLPRIFDPFFTTKAQGKGTGLGLSTVHGILKGHGGNIRVASSPGHGAKFEVFLPAQEYQDAAPAERDIPLPGGKDELVLVVDDEEGIRETVRIFLEMSGYRVVTGRNGREAVALGQEKRAEIKAVVLDLMMPEMSGDAALRVLRDLIPGLPAAAMSGLTEDFPFAEDERTVLLRKPFGKAELLATLRKLLDRRAGGG
jgi:PAS domain S-box-containing protein